MSALAGKYAFVTGGSSGIGAACARAMADAGAAVVAAGRRFPAVAPVAPVAGAVTAVQLDVTDEAQVAARMAEVAEVAEVGALDILVCAAGVSTFGPFAELSAAELRAMLDAHVVGTLVCARQALRQMMPRRAGHIVAIGSHAVRHAFADCAGYTAAKAGQLGLVRVLAAEARAHDIRVTAVLVGATDTPIWDDRPGFDRSRMLRPEAVANVVVSVVADPAVAIDEVWVMPPAGVL